MYILFNHQVPNGVQEDDWHNLNSKDCTIEERAASVKKIVCAILNISTNA